MSEPDWAIILEHLYREDGIYTRSTDVIGDNESASVAHYEALTANLRDELNLEAGTHDETHSVLNHLEINGLVESQIQKSKARLMPQPDGFEVAHERELAERQTQTNLMLVILTLALVMATIVGNQPSDSLRIWGGVIVIGFVLTALYYTDIFQIR